MKDFSNLKEGNVIINPITLQMKLIDKANGELVAVDSDGYHALEELEPKDWAVI